MRRSWQLAQLAQLVFLVAERIARYRMPLTGSLAGCRVRDWMEQSLCDSTDAVVAVMIRLSAMPDKDIVECSDDAADGCFRTV